MMKEEDFDQCPNCAEYGIFGLRIHPKFSTCYSGTTGGEPDMVMAYFHTQEHNDNFATMCRTAGEEVLFMQRWDHHDAKWIEYHV